MWFCNAKGELFNLATFASIKLLPMGQRWAIYGYSKHFENVSEGVQLTGDGTQEVSVEIMKQITTRLNAIHEQSGTTNG